MWSRRVSEGQAAMAKGQARMAGGGAEWQEPTSWGYCVFLATGELVSERTKIIQNLNHYVDDIVDTRFYDILGGSVGNVSKMSIVCFFAHFTWAKLIFWFQMVWSTWLISQCRQVWKNTQPMKQDQITEVTRNGPTNFPEPLRLEKREDKFHSNKNHNINKWLAEKFEKLPAYSLMMDVMMKPSQRGFVLLPRMVDNSVRDIVRYCLYVVHTDFISCSNSIQFLQLMSDPPVRMDTNTTYW